MWQWISTISSAIASCWGSPDEVAEQMLTLHRTTGIHHLIMSVQWPDMPQSLVLDAMHMLAEEVLPKVRQE